MSDTPDPTAFSQAADVVLPPNFGSLPAPTVYAPSVDWKPASLANAYDFGEIRVVLNAELTQPEIDQVVDALEYALKETVWAGSLAAPTAIIVSPEAQETVLEFPFPSAWVGRLDPDYDIAFRVAGIRIIHGSDVRLTDRMGPGTMGTKQVEGIGKGRCGVRFFVR